MYKDTIYKLLGTYLQLGSLVAGMCVELTEVMESEQRGHVELLYMALFSQGWTHLSLTEARKGLQFDETVRVL